MGEALYTDVHPLHVHKCTPSTLTQVTQPNCDVSSLQPALLLILPSHKCFIMKLGCDAEIKC